MRYIYLIKRDSDRQTDIAFNKKDAIDTMESWAICGCVWVDRLPKNLFKHLDSEYIEDVFENNQKSVEAVASINWD